MTDWEMVTRRIDDGEITERLEVPGGWLYRTIIRPRVPHHYSESSSPFVEDPTDVSVAMAFVPRTGKK